MDTPKKGALYLTPPGDFHPNLSIYIHLYPAHWHQNGTMLTDIEADYDSSTPMIDVNYNEDEDHQKETLLTGIEDDNDNSTLTDENLPNHLVDINYLKNNTPTMQLPPIWPGLPHIWPGLPPIWKGLPPI